MGTVLGDKKGLTLVEVMIALLLLLLVSLAMLQTALMSIDSNMLNVLRDEAVKIAAQRMDEARNSDFDTLVNVDLTVTRNVRNVPDFPFATRRTVTIINANNRQVDITVTWLRKGQTYTHTISSILSRQ